MRYSILMLCVLLGCISDIWGNCASGKGMKDLTKGGTCQSCNMDNCANCYTNWTTCDKCKSGYTLVRGKCQSCKVSHCIDCDLGINICSIGNCVSGYYYSYDTNECLKCSSNCLECISGTQCTYCNSDYCLNSQDACDSCKIDNCLSCIGTMCNQCRLDMDWSETYVRDVMSIIVKIVTKTSRNALIACVIICSKILLFAHGT